MWGSGRGVRPAGRGLPFFGYQRKRWLPAACVLAMAAAGWAQQANLGPHNIGGRGCVACHTSATDPAGPAASANDGWSHSQRCLTCHDGNLAQVMDMGGMGPWTRPRVSGPHPVNVRYLPSDRELFPVQLVEGEWRLVNNPENPFTRLKLFPRSATDPTPTVQCATCHDPHDYRNPYFLRDAYDRNLTGMKFCRTCHAEESNYTVMR